MPNFYFDLGNAGLLVIDEEGSYFATEEEARHEAITMLPEIARDRMRDGDRQRLVVTIRDGQNRRFFRATLIVLGEHLNPPPDHR